MDYGQTLDWMFSRLPMYQRQGASAYRKDLNNITLLCEHLGHPEASLKCIHVAGTNGKGSTSHMLASILQEAGYATGLFTSPHLVDFRERIRIDGQMIPREFVIEFVENHRAFFEAHDMSFFEMTTGLAFDYFKAAGADICVIETGMGGRLDSTNINTPMLSVITNIGLDHTQFLGETLSQIAREKAGIIKTGVPAVIGQTDKETRSVFAEEATANNSDIIFAEEKVVDLLASDLSGSYQRHNIRTVLAAVQELRKRISIPDESVRTGLLNVVKNTGLRGRWEKLRDRPRVIADTAHNAEGLAETMLQAMTLKFSRMRIVLGMVADKDLARALTTLPQSAEYYFCKPDLPRGLDAAELMRQAMLFGLIGTVYDSVREAYNAALEDASDDDFIYVGGSTFVVAEIL